MIGIIGVDPGTNKAGVSVLEWDGRREHLVSCDVINTPGKFRPEHLAECAEAVRGAVRDFRVHGTSVIVGIEKPFYKLDQQNRTHAGRTANWHSFGLLCRCVGAVTAAAIGVSPTEGVVVVEIGNREAKRYVSGNPNASKPEVARGVVNMLRLKVEPERIVGEGADSLAIALFTLRRVKEKGGVEEHE